jgi:hypothetical protein
MNEVLERAPSVERTWAPPARREGWETRLAEVIEWARSQRYVLGEHDCFRVACAAVEALTGEDRWTQWRGRYSTKREALALLARYGASFDDAFDWVFGSDRVDARMARRGDIVSFATTDGEKHLGVCVGAEAAVLGAEGLIFVPLSACRCCWRIG